MSEIQEILSKAQASKAGQMPCPQRVFARIAGKSDEEILAILKGKDEWIWWLHENNIVTARTLAKYGIINIADKDTGEINAGIWYIPENVTVTMNGGYCLSPEAGAIITMNGGQCLCPEAGSHVTINGGECWNPHAGAIVIDNRKGK